MCKIALKSCNGEVLRVSLSEMTTLVHLSSFGTQQEERELLIGQFVEGEAKRKTCSPWILQMVSARGVTARTPCSSINSEF